MGDASYSGPERRVDELGREAFELAVVSATKAATQEVARIHRVRLVTQSGLIAFIVAMLIALVVGSALYRGEVATAHDNSVANCHLVTGLTRTLASFVQSDATLRRNQAALNQNQQVTTGFRKLFSSSLLARLQHRSAQLDKQTFDYWQNVIVPTLRDFASSANCSKDRLK